jgi:hypothetical protein
MKGMCRGVFTVLAILYPMMAKAQAVVNTPIQFDVSPPLNQLPVKPGLSTPHPRLLPPMNLTGVSAPIVSLHPPSPSAVSARVGIGFEGVGDVGTLNCPNVDGGYAYVPSDDNLAVGTTQVVQWVNVCYAIFDKASGRVIQGPFPGNHFWSGFTGNCETQNDGDPIIQWDKAHRRWVAAQNTFVFPFLTCIAVSQTEDATGRYFRYAFPQNSGFPDYQKWGLTPNIYYQTQNDFSNDLSSYVGAYVCAYDGRALREGDPNAEQICVLGRPTDYTLLPADDDFNHEDYEDWDENAPQQEVLLGSIFNNFPIGNTVYEYVFTADFQNGTATLSGAMPITVPEYTFPFCGNGNGFDCVPQPTPGSDFLDTLGYDLMYRLAHFSDDRKEYWLVTHTIRDTLAVDARWYQFTAPKGSTQLTLAQFGDTADDAEYRWMGSVAMDKRGDIALGYSRSSAIPGDYPSIFYAGQTAGDAPGTTEAEALIHQGGGSQSASGDRWGDYTAMALDSTDGCTFWYTNQFYPQSGEFAWATWLNSLKFPKCKREDEGDGDDREGDHVQFQDDPSNPGWSSMSYQDPTAGINLASVSVGSILYSVTDAGNCVSFAGNAIVNTVPGYSYTFTACDVSVLGIGIGTFTIAVPGAGPLGLPYTKTGTLTSGAVSIYPH